MQTAETVDVKLEQGWKALLDGEFSKPYFHDLTDFVKKEYQTGTCFPPGNLIFSAFDHCKLDNLKVVILGQDPYHGIGQANGLCFSVNDGVKMPPSLKNIFKEIKSDIGVDLPENGNLERWADQGVLLLNATLTVRASQPGSHQKKGWETFTDSVISAINRNKDNVVFLLWGAYAQKKGEIIDSNRHHVLMSPHPSPFSADRGFFGNRHFSRTNDYLESQALGSIKW
jgi:uracil-DNA glycosylase